MSERTKKNTKKTEKKSDKKPDSIQNRKARGEFEILETLVAGIVLQGTEVKSLRLGRGQINEAFVKISKTCEAFLYGMTIPEYEFGNVYNHDPTRIRKLLLTEREIMKWKARAERERLTIVVLKVFFSHSWVKAEIALAKRKLLHDKRSELRKKDIDRDTERSIKSMK